MSIGSTPSDFLAACVAALGANVACATAFGHTTATPKFFGDIVAKAQMPYVRMLELPTNDTFQSMGADGLINYYERGELQVDIFDKDSQSGARAKAKLVAYVLNDGPLTFSDGILLELRQTSQFFVPEPDPGPGAAFVYHRVIIFTAMIQRNL